MKYYIWSPSSGLLAFIGVKLLPWPIVAGKCGVILFNGALNSVNTGGTNVVPNGAVSGTNTCFASVGEFSTLVVVENFGASVWTREVVAVIWNV